MIFILPVVGLWVVGVQLGAAEQRVLQRRRVRKVPDRVDERETHEGKGLIILFCVCVFVL